MKRGTDILVSLPGLKLVHHNLPEKKLDFHSHPELLVFLPLRGEIEIRLRENKRLRAVPGELVFLPEGEVHSFTSKGSSGERLIAMIDVKAWSKLGLESHPAQKISGTGLLRELFLSLLLDPSPRHCERSEAIPGDEASNHGIASPSGLAMTREETPSALSLRLVETALLWLDHQLSQRVAQKFATENASLNKLLDLVEEDLSATLKITTLARKIGISQKTLQRAMKQEWGLTPKQLLIQLRMQRAESLLSQRQLSVTQVSMEVGYQSLSQFIATYRAYRNQ